MRHPYLAITPLALGCLAWSLGAEHAADLLESAREHASTLQPDIEIDADGRRIGLSLDFGTIGVRMDLAPDGRVVADRQCVMVREAMNATARAACAGERLDRIIGHPATGNAVVDRVEETPTGIVLVLARRDVEITAALADLKTDQPAARRAA